MCFSSTSRPQRHTCPFWIAFSKTPLVTIASSDVRSESSGFLSLSHGFSGGFRVFRSTNIQDHIAKRDQSSCYGRRSAGVLMFTLHGNPQ